MSSPQPRKGKMCFGLITSTGGAKDNKAYGFYYAPHGISGPSSETIASVPDADSHIIQMANLQRVDNALSPQPSLHKTPRSRTCCVNISFNLGRSLKIFVAISIIIIQLGFAAAVYSFNRPVDWGTHTRVVRWFIVIFSMLGFEALITICLCLILCLYTRNSPKTGVGKQKRTLIRSVRDSLLIIIYFICMMATLVHCLYIKEQ